MKQLHEKTAIVTGADRDIGRDIALCLSQLGVKVICTGSCKDSLLRTVEMLTAAARKGCSVVCDATDRAQVRETVQKAVELYGTIDIMVNTVLLPEQSYSLIESVQYADMHTVWMAGTMVPLSFMQECFPHMAEQREGRIVNLIFGCKNNFSDLMVQASIRCLTQAAAGEWEKYGIGVSCAFVVSKDNLPSVVAFLSGPDSRFYSGKCLLVDGISYSVLP